MSGPGRCPDDTTGRPRCVAAVRESAEDPAAVPNPTANDTARPAAVPAETRARGLVSMRTPLLPSVTCTSPYIRSETKVAQGGLLAQAPSGHRGLPRGRNRL